MQVGRVEGATRTLGKAQGYLGLPVRDGSVHCTVNGDNTPTMTSAWIPTPKELEALNAGAAVHLCIVGGTHPPVMVDVGEPPADAPSGDE